MFRYSIKKNGQEIEAKDVASQFEGDQWVAQNESRWGHGDLSLSEKEAGMRGLTAEQAASTETGEDGQPIYHFAKTYELDVKDLSQDADWLLAQCLANRQAEYPSIQEIVVTMIEGDEQKIADIKARRAATKAKYPKP